MDGEPTPGCACAYPPCCSNGEAAEKWHIYNLIGDAMRDKCGVLPHARPRREAPSPARDDRASQRTTNHPRAHRARGRRFAGDSSVGWIGNQGGQVPSGAVVARAPGTVQPALIPAADIQDYVVAHRQLPSAELYRPVVNSRGAPAAPAR
jgi:hypothetical protein